MGEEGKGTPGKVEGRKATKRLTNADTGRKIFRKSTVKEEERKRGKKRFAATGKTIFTGRVLEGKKK